MKKNYIFIALLVPLIGILNPCGAQSYKNLVLEGAGIRGVAYAGVIKFMEEKKMLNQIEKSGVATKCIFATRPSTCTKPSTTRQIGHDLLLIMARVH